MIPGGSRFTHPASGEPCIETQPKPVRPCGMQTEPIDPFQTSDAGKAKDGST